MSIETDLVIIESFRQQFITIKSVAEDEIYSLRNQNLYAEPFRKDSYYPTDEQPYSIGIIMQRTIGNLTSRWTDFLTSDGEKGRNIEKEFKAQHLTNEELLEKWQEAWMILFKAIVEELEMKPENFSKTIYVNKQPFTVQEALLRQMSYHMYYSGQIALLAKVMKRENGGDLLTVMDKAEEPR